MNFKDKLNLLKNKIAEVNKSIDFPEEEYDDVSKRLEDGKIVWTVRVDKEYKKFNKGDVLNTPWEYKVKVKDSKLIDNIKDYEHYDELTNEQKNELKEYDKLQVLELKKMDDVRMKEDFNLYHASEKQGLRQLRPEYSKTRIKKNIKGVYASNDESYAAGFCFNWSEDEGFEFGRINNGKWTLEVPKKYKNRLDKPCSIYTVGGNFNKINIGTPEFVSDENVKVLSEEKFDTAKDCLEKNGVEIRIV